MALALGWAITSESNGSSAATVHARPPAIPQAQALVINEDNSHFFSSRGPEQMNREGLLALVDGYAGTAVTHLFFSPNSMRASFRSHTRDAIWDPVDGREPEARWAQHAKRLHEAGLDPYAIWLERTRERGMSAWLSMRMNDVHSVDDPQSYLHSEFWRRHPELRRVPGGPAQPWVNHALNYAHAAVREHQFAFVAELLARYTPDGLELDWMRFGHHLTPGAEASEAGILTAFVARVRQELDTASARAGRRLLLGVRVPAHPDAARGLGMDAITWARTGLVDLIVPCPFWRTSDFDIPLEVWRQQLGSAADRVAVVPGFEHNLRAWLGGVTVPNDLASARGFAAAMYARGADSLYLFNWMDSETRPVDAESYRELLTRGLTPASLIGQPRRHPVTYRDTTPPKFPDGTQLPRRAPEARFRVTLGPPETGPGRDAVLIGFADAIASNSGPPRVELNGHALSGAEQEPNIAPMGGVRQAWRFPGARPFLRTGENVVRVLQAEPLREIVWVEIRVNER